MGSVEPRDETGERLRVPRFWRQAPCNTLDNADATDFVGDGVVALRRSHGKPASLFEVDAIGRAGECGMGSMSKTDALNAIAASSTLRLLPARISHAGKDCGNFTGMRLADARLCCSFAEVATAAPAAGALD